jgi:hypothetical protein
MMIDMEKRHNENQKMNERIRAEENKKAKLIAQNLSEREQMENPKKPVKILFLGQKGKGLFFPKFIIEADSFQVVLPQILSISEIKQRMEKAFGDI